MRKRNFKNDITMLPQEDIKLHWLFSPYKILFMFNFITCDADALKHRSLMSEVVLQQTVTVIPPDVRQSSLPIQLSAQTDSTLSTEMVCEQLSEYT